MPKGPKGEKRTAATIDATRSDFMLKSARAEDAMLDRTLFALDDRRFAKFVRALDWPQRPSKRLRRLLAKSAPRKD